MVVTVAERKEQARERRRAAIEAVLAVLAAHARDHGGRYVVYGSVAAGRIRADSDLDLLIDFPESAESEAWRAAEEAAGAHGVPLDAKPIGWASPPFLARVLPTARMLPTGAVPTAPPSGP